MSRNPDLWLYAVHEASAPGSAIWAPSILWIAVVLMAAGIDLRARAEEVVLEQAPTRAARGFSAGNWPL